MCQCWLSDGELPHEMFLSWLVSILERNVPLKIGQNRSAHNLSGIVEEFVSIISDRLKGLLVLPRGAEGF